MSTSWFCSTCEESLIWLYVSFPCVRMQQEQSQYRHSSEGPSSRTEAPHWHPTCAAAHWGQGGHQTDRHVAALDNNTNSVQFQFPVAHMRSFLKFLVLFAHLLAHNRGGQGSSAGDRHRVQPIRESAEFLYRRVSAPPSPYPELRAFDWYVRHTSRHKWVFLVR